MKIANGVEMLEISSDVMGRSSVIYPVLIWDNKDAILVDAGFPGQLEHIREAVEKSGLPFDKLNKIIITHHDIDHIGSLSSIINALPKGAEVLAHGIEKPYIQGDKVPVKLTQLKAAFDSLSADMKGFYEKLKAGFENCRERIDRTLEDGEELPYCGGITVIFTPGHTPGHICLYIKQSKTLIAGDLLAVENGKLIKAPAHINYDGALAEKSIKKLTEYDIEVVICYHGGLYKYDTNNGIAALASKE